MPERAAADAEVGGPARQAGSLAGQTLANGDEWCLLEDETYQ